MKITTKVFRPTLDEGMDIIDLSIEDIVDEAIFSFGTVCDCTLENYETEKITFKQVIFQKVVFNEITFRRIELINVRFENCDLSNVDFNEGLFFSNIKTT